MINSSAGGPAGLVLDTNYSHVPALQLLSREEKLVALGWISPSENPATSGGSIEVMVSDQQRNLLRACPANAACDFSAHSSGVPTSPLILSLEMISS